MTPLILTPDIRAVIDRAVAFADAHRYYRADIERIISNDLRPPGDVPELVVEIPMGFRCVCTISQSQADPPSDAWYRHLSISMPYAPVTRCVNEFAAAMIMQAYGFKKSLLECEFWLSDWEGGRKIVNIVEPLEAETKPAI